MTLLVDRQEVTITTDRQLVDVPQFVEWGHHQFELRPGRPVEAALEVGGRIIEATRGYKDPTIIRWHWGTDVVRDRIGYVPCRLWLDEDLIVDTEILIEPSKMTLDDYQAMIAETRALAYNLFYDLRSTTYKHLDLGFKDFPKSDLEYLEIIDKMADQLGVVLSRIARAPNRRLRARLDMDYLWEARRLSSGSVVWLATQGISTLERAENAEFSVVERLRGYLPTRIQTEDWTIDYDVHENRAIKYFLGLLSSRLRRIPRELREKEQPTLERCHRKVTYLQELPFLNDVGELRTHVRYTVVFDREANYHQFYQLYRRYHWQLAFDPPKDALENLYTLTMKELWRVYEMWCYFKVVDVLKKIVKGQAIDQRDVFRIINFNEAVPALKDRSKISLRTKDGKEIEVWYKQTFWPLGSDRSGRFVSVSRRKIPDIVVEGEGRLMLLDAKYRLDSENAVEELSPSERGKPQHRDIDAMHAYRDAIRTEDDQRAADWAYILYPGSKKELHDHDRLGAIPLMPGDDAALRELLDRWINEAA